MIRQGDVVTYLLMCSEEGVVLRRGMNFKLRGGHTVVLMSQREGAPYADRVEEDGRVLIYEGHDIGKESLDPKSVDQPEFNPDGSLTQNVLFLEAAAKYKRGEREPEVVKVYEKIRPSIWVYNSLFKHRVLVVSFLTVTYTLFQLLNSTLLRKETLSQLLLSSE